MKKKIIITSGIAVLVIVLTAVYFLSGNKEMKFRTEKLAKGDITAAVSATGNVNAVTNVLVGTQVSGTIKNIYVDFNSIVKKGQLIAQIDPTTFEAQVDQARANLMSSKANEDKANVTVLDAKRTMERYKELFAKNLIARSDLDVAETNYLTSVAAASSAKAQVAQTAAALKIAETNLRYTRILSPVNGIVVSRNVDVGQTVAASFQTPTLFTIAQDLTKMQIDTNVDEADIGKIAVGQKVEFNIDAYPEITFKGVVAQIRNSPINVQNVITYDVVVMVDNSDMKLKPGMTANVSIIIASQKNVLKVSNAALRFRLSEAPEKTAGKPGKKSIGIWILENKKPKRINIKTGLSDGNYTEVISEELKEGQEVIVEALTQQKSGSTKQSGGPRLF
ncbi:MAG: efflux RND transporter periplasmic adaptor subunit [Nitrospiraceae bacterium]|nr:efflux RND transporter periplasmic adaptor subunit [Nitrospiraceae bacterium]